MADMNEETAMDGKPEPKNSCEVSPGQTLIPKSEQKLPKIDPRPGDILTFPSGTKYLVGEKGQYINIKKALKKTEKSDK